MDLYFDPTTITPLTHSFPKNNFFSSSVGVSLQSGADGGMDRHGRTSTPLWLRGDDITRAYLQSIAVSMYVLWGYW